MSNASALQANGCASITLTNINEEYCTSETGLNAASQLNATYNAITVWILYVMMKDIVGHDEYGYCRCTCGVKYWVARISLEGLQFLRACNVLPCLTSQPRSHGCDYGKRLGAPDWEHYALEPHRHYLESPPTSQPEETSLYYSSLG